MNHYDVIVIGAGCSGLAIARELATQGYSGSVMVIDGRTEHANDRTWCFWADPQSLWQQHAKYHWSEVCFSDINNHSVVHNYSDAGELAYCCLPADVYYQFCLRTLQNSNVQMMLGNPVNDCQDLGDRVIVKTKQAMLSASWIIDTRYAQSEHQSTLYQSFYGAEVLLKQPIAANHRARLMADLHCEGEGTYFYYLLPFSDRHVLIEPTRFHPQADIGDLADKIDYVCARENIEIEQVLRIESGVLPMGITTSPSGGRLIKAGISAGGLRPSTGYGFMRIQGWAERCARHLINKGRPIAHAKDTLLQRNMDKLFLSVIKNNPEIAPSLFIALANNLSANEFAQFMSDKQSLGRWLSVINSVPNKKLFMQSIPRLFSEAS